MMIVFSGTDGAGKSTQIDLLIKRLPHKKVKILWGRGGYTPVFEFMKKSARKLMGGKIPHSGINDEREKMLKNKSVSKLWLTIATLDLILYYGIYIRYLIISGNAVICDRYINDTLIDFRRNFPHQFNEDSFLWKFLVKSVAKPDYSFLLYVPAKTSIVRSKMKNDPFPDSPETLTYRLKMYMDESIFPSEQYHKIDCQQPVYKIQEEIQRVIFTNS